MADAKRKKETICATVSPYTKKQVDMLVESGEFSSMSDLVSVAITEFLTKYNAEKQKALTQAPIIQKEPNKQEEPQGKKPEWIVYDHQKEREECLRKLCPNPRELTPEEARKAAEAKAYYRALRGEDEEPEEPKGKKPGVLLDGEAKDYPREWILE